jgi:hypothetical protein
MSSVTSMAHSVSREWRGYLEQKNAPHLEGRYQCCRGIVFHRRYPHGHIHHSQTHNAFVPQFALAIFPLRAALTLWMAALT